MARFPDPFRALVGLQNALDATRRSDWFGGATASRGAFPLINVFRDGDDFLVVAELPGVKKEDLNVQIRQKHLRLAGKKSIDFDEGASVHRRERIGGAFDRTITFPVAVDAENAKADYHDGILKLHVPRSPSEKPRTIAIS